VLILLAKSGRRIEAGKRGASPHQFYSELRCVADAAGIGRIQQPQDIS
jgi:hypothetical protein